MSGLGTSSERFQPSLTLGRSRYGNLLAFGLPILTMCASLLTWEAASLIFEIPSYLVPRPSEFLLRLGTSFPEIAYHGWATTQVILISFLLSGIIGVLLAYLLVTWESLERGVYPLLVFLQIIPKTIAAPVFLVWFGIGTMPKFLLTTFITFFPILVDSIAGFRSVDPRLYYLSKSMGASRWQTFRDIQLPAALPHIFSGFKIASVYAVTAVITVEFIGSRDGLGNLMIHASNFTDMTLMFAAIIATALLGLAFGLAISSIESLVMPWMKFR